MLERYSRSNQANHKSLLDFVTDPNNERFFRRISSLSSSEVFENLESLLNAQFYFFFDHRNLAPAALLGVFRYDQAAGVAEVGCCVAPQMSNQGVSTQALGELAARLFYGNVFFEKLTATCLAEDTHSRHVLEKTGWEQEGYFKRHVYTEGYIQDEVQYALYREVYERLYGYRFTDRKDPQLRDQDEGPFGQCAGAGVGPQDGVEQKQAAVETDSGGCGDSGVVP